MLFDGYGIGNACLRLPRTYIEWIVISFILNQKIELLFRCGRGRFHDFQHLFDFQYLKYYFYMLYSRLLIKV